MRALNLRNSPSSTLICDLHGRVARRLDAGDEVGEPADLLLEDVVDTGHDLGVHAEPGHHQEAGVGADRLTVVGVRVGDRLAGGVVEHRVGPERGEVDGLVLPTEGDVERIADVEGEAQVPCEQVAGAVGDDTDGHAGAGGLLADGADRAVAARGDEEVDALLERLLRLSVPGVLDRGLEPVRLRPPVLQGHPC